jgi:uncharacterized repeat protein (TIGR01451 family)
MELLSLNIVEEILTPTRMKTLLHLMALILISSGAIAQTTGFKNNYFDASGNIGTDVCQTVDGGYIMCGMHSLINTAGQREYRAEFMKTDSLGQVSWTKNLSSNYSPTNIYQTKDGGYMVFGEISYTGNNQYGSSSLLKLNSTGDSVWMKPISNIYSALPTTWKTTNPRNSNWKRMLIQTPDSSFFILGNCQSSSHDIYITKFSAQGDSLMADTISGNAMFMEFNAKLTATGGLAIVIPDSNKIRLTVLAQNGSKLWRNYIPTAGVLMAAPLVSQTADGGYIVASQNPSGMTQNNLFKTDANGNVIWSQYLSVIGTGSIGTSIMPCSDGGIVISGVDPANIGTGYVTGMNMVAKTDGAGTLLWTKKLVADTNMKQQIYAIIPTRDGGYAVGGYAMNTLNNFSGMMLIKTDQNGDSYSLIKGRVFLDKNHNCNYDINDQPLYNRQVTLNPNGITAVTDSLGYYSFKVGLGSYSVSSVNGNYTTTVCPGGGAYAVSVTALGKNFTDLNFADTALASCPDLSITLGTCGLGLCYRNTYTINYANKGLVADSNAMVTITPDSALIFLSSSIPWTYTAPNTYTFNLGELKAGQTGNIQIIDSVSCAATVGKTVCAKARIYSSMQECDTTNNNSSDCRLITSSMDPNEMLVAVQNTKSPVFVNQQVVNSTDSLQYFIRFQNIGTGAAVNINISDTLSSRLDAGSVILGTSSSPCTLTIKNGILNFHFAQIMLADSASNPTGSIGFVSFYVRQKKNNVAGTLINNRASIVFDYNKAIATNKTLNYIPLITGIQEIAAKSEMTIFPNPSNGDHLNIEFSSLNTGKEVLVVLYDLQGRETYSKIIITSGGNHPIASVDPSHSLSPGIYLIVATSDNRIYKQKIVIE